MDMNILKYMAFIKTVEYGSFTKAADILNYSQSGISRMINDLEKEWGISLLERSRAGVSLTPDGLRLLSHAKSLCDEYQKLQSEIDDLHGVHSGLIRIGTISICVSLSKLKLISSAMIGSLNLMDLSHCPLGCRSS